MYLFVKNIYIMCIYFLNIFIRKCDNLTMVLQVLFVNIRIFHYYGRETVIWTIVVTILITILTTNDKIWLHKIMI